MTDKKCPCHSNKPYEDCCKQYHNQIFCDSVVSLMRSRYSAYALGNAAYITSTTHTENIDFKKNTKKWVKDIKQYVKTHQFVGLTIHNSHQNKAIGFVEFTASVKQSIIDRSFKEKSTFKKENGIWKYHSGEISF
jgi:SEC-C motif domain protein